MLPANILVVDDGESVGEVISSILSAEGYLCRPCSTATEALEVLHGRADFHLMLSDLMMPHADGLGMLRKVSLSYPDMPIILVTAVDDVSTAVDAIHCGAYDYLRKPFHRQALLASVRRALEHQHLKRQNREYQTMLESLVADRTQQLTRALGDLERSYDVTLQALGAALDLRDAETEGHSQRVTAYSSALARTMRLPEEMVRVIARGAFLHDIGKIAIPDSILRKPGPLTDEETAVMREHCLIGYRMLSRIPFLRGPSEIVYAHQERFDGTGYPRGLKGGQIPLGARIFAIADTLDAMTSDRPYRLALPPAAARQEIERWSGLQFDPDIASIFLRMPEHLWGELREQISLGASGLLLPSPGHANQQFTVGSAAFS
ncbi:MAG: response regulator [Acidobacteriales bacterium]|nr:response regulator [Terriglobales bacterium]